MVVFGHGIMLFVNALGRRIKNERGQTPVNRTAPSLPKHGFIVTSVFVSCVRLAGCRRPGGRK